VPKDQYSIITVEILDKHRVEQMGSKPKFWSMIGKTDEAWLFKYARENTGEDWAEKVAAELAALLGLPHANVELAVCEGRRGIISKDFTCRRKLGELVHGNELLVELDSSYPQREFYRVSQHMVQRIKHSLSQDFVTSAQTGNLPGELSTPLALFLGYLLLDALIGNTDRHHENWGVLDRTVNGERVAELAPTFDHASSMGRELTDARIAALLDGSNQKTTPCVESYADRARSAIFHHKDDTRPLSPLEAFRLFSSGLEEARILWLDILRELPDYVIDSSVKRVPPHVLTSTRAAFVCRFLRYNKQELLRIEAEK